MRPFHEAARSAQQAPAAAQNHGPTACIRLHSGALLLMCIALHAALLAPAAIRSGSATRGKAALRGCLASQAHASAPYIVCGHCVAVCMPLAVH